MGKIIYLSGGKQTLKALVSIHETTCDEDVSEIEKFICPGKKKEEYALPEIRVYV